VDGGEAARPTPFEFENWAVIALGGVQNKSKVGDMGNDGRIFPIGTEPAGPKSDELALHERWYPIQVKQKDKVGRPDIDSFETAMRRSQREKGFFVRLRLHGGRHYATTRPFFKTTHGSSFA